MRLRLCVVGRMKRGPELEIFARYRERCGWDILLDEIDVKQADAKRALQLENQKLLQVIKKADHVVALDRGGQDISSAAISRRLCEWRDNGASEVALVIGGADGLEGELLGRCDARWRFGSATWPHMLCRVMLMEQLYRAWAIRSGHPYHH